MVAINLGGEAPVRCQDIRNTNGQHIGNRMAKTRVTTGSGDHAKRAA
jgi:hypothetical protein